MNIIIFCQFGANHSCDPYLQGKEYIGVSFGTKIKSNGFFLKLKLLLMVIFCFV